MKFLSTLLISFLVSSLAFGRTANQVNVMPASGNLPTWGQVDVSQNAAVKNQLRPVNGGTGQDTSASTGAAKVSSGTWSVGTLPYSDGGTNQTTALGAFQNFYETVATTGGDLIYGGASGVPTRLANGSAGQVLTSNGGTSAPSWNSIGSPKPPASVSLKSGTSATQNEIFAFTVSSASATVGATYTNNSTTFTVYATVSSSTLIYLSGSGNPTASGTLTKTGGTGDSTITFSSFNAPLYAKLQIVGAGGGGGGGSSNGSPGSVGGDTSITDGTNTLDCGGGSGGPNGSAFTLGGAGGAVSNTIVSGVQLLSSLSGAYGGPSNGNTAMGGSMGGVSPFGGAGAGGGALSTPGRPAIANTGSGGGGGTINAATSSAGGGGAGAYQEAIFTTIVFTYTYTIGGGGGGGGSVSGGAGGAGGDGAIYMTFYYQ